MRAPQFRKLNNEWIARPFQGWEYKIVKRWLKGYVLYFNGAYLASDAKLALLKQTALKHLAEATEGRAS